VGAARWADGPHAVVADWHRAGRVALVEARLPSLERFSVLLDRQQRVAAASQANDSEAPEASSQTRKTKKA
jgi:hypothetical protein